MYTLKIINLLLVVLALVEVLVIKRNAYFNKKNKLSSMISIMLILTWVIIIIGDYVRKSIILNIDIIILLLSCLYFFAVIWSLVRAKKTGKYNI